MCSHSRGNFARVRSGWRTRAGHAIFPSGAVRCPDRGSWTGGRAVECSGLENRQTFTGLVGSNPTLSVRCTGWVPYNSALAGHARRRYRIAPRVSILDPRTAVRLRSGGREAEGGGLLNRYRVVKPYRGFESLPLRPCEKARDDRGLFRFTGPNCSRALVKWHRGRFHRRLISHLRRSVLVRRTCRFLPCPHTWPTQSLRLEVA